MNAQRPIESRARALLHELSGPHGIYASRAQTANYRAVFTRDAVMAGIAGLLIGDPKITTGFVATLDALRERQGPEGQIASNYQAGAGDVSFGSIVPRLDAACWYLIGVGLAARAGAIDFGRFRDSVARVADLLNALEYNGRHLIYVPTGGDWADEWVYEGYVLHEQVLRAWGLRLVAPLAEEERWHEKSRAIAGAIEERFCKPSPPGENGYPLCAFTPTRRFDMFDLAATALLSVSRLAPSSSPRHLDWIERTFLAQERLPPVFSPVIQEGSADWDGLQRYHLHEFRNRPHEYHNGGIWPIWLGWLALALAGAGHSAACERLRQLATAAMTHPSYRFEEFFHGQSLTPLGTPDMAYTATGAIFLHSADADVMRILLSA